MYEYYAIGIYGLITITSRAFSKNAKLLYAFMVYSIMIIILIRFLLITDNGLYLNYKLAF